MNNFNRLDNKEEEIKLLKRLLMEYGASRKVLNELNEAKDKRNEILEEIRA